MEAKAIARHVRVTPRKARRMVDLIRGKKATEAVTILKFAPQAAALPVRKVDARCRATIGEVGNSEHANIQLGKAGRARWMGKRPWTRGESMNPVDHPHGGRTRGGKPPVSPWGKGEVRTRRPKKASNKMIVRRRPNGKNRK